MENGEPIRKIGILPMGALGAAFFYHLHADIRQRDDSVFFIERRGSSTVRAQREHGSIHLAFDGMPHQIASQKICRDDLLTCTNGDWMPEAILVCPQSDRILPVVTTWVELLECLYARVGLTQALDELPLLVLCSNGIYHQRVRRFLVETLEESMLYGRLPDLWSRPMGVIVGKMLRGVTMQTGQRQGEGTEAVFQPGPAGLTRLAGGDALERRRCGELFHGRGVRMEIEDEHSPTRVEFDKALVNLFANLLGQFRAINEQGVFRLATVREILPEPDSLETRELAHHVIAVGRAVQAYGPEESDDAIYRSAMAVVRGPLDHVPSSIKWIETQLRAGTLQARITPTERWLLEPLMQYATTAGLEESCIYFDWLIERIENRLARAIEFQSAEPMRLSNTAN